MHDTQLNVNYQDDMYSFDEPVARFSRTLNRRSRPQSGTSASVHVRNLCCCLLIEEKYNITESMEPLMSFVQQQYEFKCKKKKTMIGLWGFLYIFTG